MENYFDWRQSGSAELSRCMPIPKKLRQEALDIADSIWEWQNDISGPPHLSAPLTNEDIEILEAARTILEEYSDWECAPSII